MSDPRAQQMRRHASKAEWVLWRSLREMRAPGFHFRRQVRFGPYILDFVSHRERLVIEVDGDQHGLPGQQAYDEKRTKVLEAQSYRVLRFGNRDVLTNLAGVIDGIEAALHERRGVKF